MTDRCWSCALEAAALLLWSAPAIADKVDRWSPEIANASARFAIPQAWVRRVIEVESGGQTLLHGRPTVSSAGAMGLMQLMPDTWRDMRLALGLGPDPYDPADNILAGTAYLRLMYDRFGYPGLFGAYNAGPARYAAYLAGAGPLPAETRAYVARILRTGTSLPVDPRKATRPATLFAVVRGEDPALAEAVPLGRPAGLFVELSGSGQ